MVTGCVLFEVWTEFLNIIYMSSGSLFLSGGRPGVAWEPSNEVILFLPPRKIKYLSVLPLISSLQLLFIFLSLSLSLSALLQTVNSQTQSRLVISWDTEVIWKERNVLVEITGLLSVE
jgi:hypothetical protein